VTALQEPPIVGIPRDERTVADEAFFAALDLSRPELASIGRALEAGDLPAARGALVEHFRVRTRPVWFLGLRDAPRGRRGAVPSSWDATTDEGLARANAALEHRFTLAAGLPYDFGPGLDWRTDEMRGLGSPPSAFKRCLFMRDLAHAYAQTGDPRYTAKLAYLLGRWLDDWPLVIDEDFGPRDAIMSKADGHKAMPTAFRVVTWWDVLYGGALFAPEVPRETAFRLIKSIWFTTLQYRRYATSPYVPANHHLWERGAAPFILGSMLPEFPEVAKLVGQGIAVIRRHADHGFLPDGGYEERSTAYTYGPMHMFLMPLDFARLNGVELLSQGQATNIRGAIENMARLSLPTGDPPDTGDGGASAAKSARLFARAHRALGGSPVCVTAIRRLELGHHLEPVEREAFTGEAALEVELPLTVHFPHSGYFVARDGWTRRASALSLSVPDHGLPNHSHDDALSLQLVARGARLVGTPASSLYNFVQQDTFRAHPLRGYFRGMESHNVVLVHGAPLRSNESLAPGGGPSPTPVETTWEAVPDGIRVHGHHTAYPGVRLSREVVFRHAAGWVVRDRVAREAAAPQPPVGRPSHVARWHFEFGVEVEQSGPADFLATGAAADQPVSLRISCTSPTSAIGVRLYRDHWLEDSPLRRKRPLPWVIDVSFGGGTDDALETRFDIQ
jgi:hypothetical protein